MWKLIIFYLTLVSFVYSQAEEEQSIWQQDLSDSFKIDASTKGLQRVHLICGANSMQLELETNEDFNGVMYTRGSFYKQTEPCFVKPKLKKGARSLAMKFNLDQCQTLHENDVYSNVVVVQHDAELVTPGDAAFSIVCNFRKPRNIAVEANLQTRDRQATSSRISLTSPDPSVSPHYVDNQRDTVTNDSNIVTFMVSEINDKTAEGTVETVNERYEDEL